MNLPRSVFVAVVMILSSIPLAHAAQQASCTFDTFSAPSGYSLSMVEGVSDDGTVVGQLVDDKTLQYVAFTRSASGVFTEYTAPKSLTTWMYGRNAGGANAGFYQDTAYPEHLHGFQLQGSQLTVVNYPNAVNTWLFGSNMTGASVGSFSTSASLIKGFMLANGKYTTIAYQNAQITNPLAINDQAEVVGSYTISGINNGFTWKNGTFTTINYPKARFGTVLTGMNNSGMIVGNHLSAEKTFGFLYVNGGFEGIVYPGAKFTTAGGINNNGLVSGQIFITGTNTLGYTAVCK